MKKFISISVALLLAISPMTVFADGGVVPAPNAEVSGTGLPESYMQGMDPAEKILAQAIFTGYYNVAPSLKLKVAEAVRPKLEALGKKVYEKMEANKGEFDQITYRKNDLADITAGIPPESVINSIPAEALGAVKMKVRQEILAGIQESFARIPGEVDAAVRASLAKVSPIIIEEVKPYVKQIIFDIGDLIDQNINDSIDGEISKVLPQVIDLLPDTMDGLSPEEIAEKYRVKMEPAAEAALRPVLENEIKEVIDAQIEELVEKPIAGLMDPKIDQIDDASVYGILEKIPSYLNRIITNEEIRGIVETEMVKLKEKLPGMIDGEQTDMKMAVRAEIEKFIDDNTKLYIDGKMANIKMKILNSKAFINYTDIKKATGEKATYSTKKKSITISNGKKTVEFTLNSMDIKVDGKVMKGALEGTEVPAMNGKIPIIPMEVLAEQFGQDFKYNPEWGMSTLEDKE